MIARSVGCTVAIAFVAACHTRTIEDGRRPMAPFGSSRPASAAVLASGFEPDTLVPADTAATHEHGAATVYTCTHHPEVRSNAPGKCPKCGMDLVPVKGNEASP